MAHSSSPLDAAADLTPDEFDKLVDRIVAGDAQALATLFTHYRQRLWRLVSFRLHPKLRGRVDPDDVLQDAWMRAVERIEYFLRDASRSAFVWFRMVVCQTLVETHRRHMGAEKRTASREFSISQKFDSKSTSSSLAFHLQGSLTSPSSALSRAETAKQIDAVLGGMSDIDREVLALRHFEHLTNAETAQVLEMSEQAASIRYIRALKRLKGILELLPDFKMYEPKS